MPLPQGSPGPQQEVGAAVRREGGLRDADKEGLKPLGLKLLNVHLFANALLGFYKHWWVSQVDSWYRTCLPMWETYETQFQSLGPEDSLEEGMATHSSILA